MKEHSVMLKLKKVTIVFLSLNYTVKPIATRSYKDKNSTKLRKELDFISRAVQFSVSLISYKHAM